MFVLDVPSRASRAMRKEHLGATGIIIGDTEMNMLVPGALSKAPRPNTIGSLQRRSIIPRRHRTTPSASTRAIQQDLSIAVLCTSSSWRRRSGPRRVSSIGLAGYRRAWCCAVQDASNERKCRREAVGKLILRCFDGQRPLDLAHASHNVRRFLGA
jgi:hypothetical protein